MTTSAGSRRRHLATSPFLDAAEPVIEQYACHDLVSHDTYGMGRVLTIEPEAVTVDFGTQKVRVVSPYRKLAKL
jgi:hypothetical protein